VNALSDIFSAMIVNPLDVSTQTARSVALERWNIDAEATALTGERDRNFHLRAADGREFVMKFANPAEAASVSALQISALRHIERTDPTLSVPRMIPLPGSALETTVPLEAGGVQRVRMLSWIPGVSLHSARRSAAQRTACGQMLARVQVALKDFSHPAADHDLIWDLQHTPRLREVTGALTHARARAVVDELLDEFDAVAAPMLPTLRRQAVHNDMNHLNTLVDAADHDRVAGLIDFGDMVRTAIVIDVATGGFPQLGPDMGAAEALGCYVGGFHAVQPLLPEEVTVMPSQTIRTTTR
jgi:hydroxylysine kinase